MFCLSSNGIIRITPIGLIAQVNLTLFMPLWTVEDVIHKLVTVMRLVLMPRFGMSIVVKYAIMVLQVQIYHLSGSWLVESSMINV